ncbi:MAG: phage portal protein [Chloroflexi bacterium]|nr:phage portal protein [Chloroflexota bacterium]
MKFGLDNIQMFASGLKNVVTTRIRSGGAHRKANRSTRITVDRFDATEGIGGEWSSSRYGDYYTTSAAVYAAVRTRADAVGRPPLLVEKLREGGGSDIKPVWQPVDHSHPLQRLIDKPNDAWSRVELIRTIESNLLLWGSAFLGIERDDTGLPGELWPLRSDRMRVLPDARKYVKGFVYEYAGERVAYLPEEVVWFKSFNPLEEFAGLSCVAPARLSIDMGFEAQRFNRNFFANSATPGDLAITTDETPTDDEVSEFYSRWDSRFKGSGKSHRPILLGKGMDAKRLGLSQRDMDFAKALEWSVEEVSRAFGVSTVFLSELENATLSNVHTFERFLWRNTVVPELRLIEDCLTRGLVTALGFSQHEYRFRFDLSAIEALNDSEDSVVAREVSLVNAGVMTPNEVRVRHGLIPEGWGALPRQGARQGALHGEFAGA